MRGEGGLLDPKVTASPHDGHHPGAPEQPRHREGRTDACEQGQRMSTMQVHRQPAYALGSLEVTSSGRSAEVRPAALERRPRGAYGPENSRFEVKKAFWPV